MSCNRLQNPPPQKKANKIYIHINISLTSESFKTLTGLVVVVDTDTIEATEFAGAVGWWCCRTEEECCRWGGGALLRAIYRQVPVSVDTGGRGRGDRLGPGQGGTEDPEGARRQQSPSGKHGCSMLFFTSPKVHQSELDRYQSIHLLSTTDSDPF